MPLISPTEERKILEKFTRAGKLQVNGRSMVHLGYHKLLENNMFPSKIRIDCVGHKETSRLFPSIGMDGDMSNVYISPLQTPITNRYSSSTDNSTSPESYFNTPFKITSHLAQSTPRLDTQTYDRKIYNTIPYDSAVHIIETPISNLTQLIYGPYDRKSFEQNYNDSRSTSFDSKFLNIFDKNVTAFENQYNKRCKSFESNLLEDNRSFDRNMIGFEPQNNNSRCTSFESHYPSSEQQKYDQVQIGNTPLHFRRPRAIVGRKILDSSNPSSKETIKSGTDEFNKWQPHSPDESPEMQYELFPSKTNTKNEFITPKQSTGSKLSPFASPFMSRTPPNPTQYYDDQSPTSSRIHPSPTLNMNRFQSLSPDSLHDILPLCIPPPPNRLPFPEFKPPYNPSLYAGSSSRQDKIRSNKICTFCRKNGETPSIYANHCVKEKKGNKYIVSCPILRNLVCLTCGATGDNAHTITYCPVLTSTNKGKPLPSTTITLKNTRIKSNGRKRY